MATWTTVYDGSGFWSVAHAEDPGWSGYTFVATLALAAFSATGGTQIRLSFIGSNSAEGFEANAMWVGNGGGGDVWDFTGDQVQLKQGGSNTISCGGSNAIIVTDDGIAFVKDATNPLVLAMQFSNSAHDDLGRWNDGGLNYGDSWFKPAVQEASTQNKSGYTHNVTSNYIYKIELLMGAADADTKTLTQVTQANVGMQVNPIGY